MLPTMGPHGVVSNMNALAGKAVQADDVIRFKLAAVEDELGKPLETTKAGTLYCWVSGQKNNCLYINKQVCTGCSRNV